MAVKCGTRSPFAVRVTRDQGAVVRILAERNQIWVEHALFDAQESLLRQSNMKIPRKERAGILDSRDKDVFPGASGDGVEQSLLVGNARDRLEEDEKIARQVVLPGTEKSFVDREIRPGPARVFDRLCLRLDAMQIGEAIVVELLEEEPLLRQTLRITASTPTRSLT